MSLSAVSSVVHAVLTRARNVLCAVLAAGPIPRHVAFVMDGNRRYARSRHKRVQEGHADGFIALRRMLEICMRLNVRCVSVYAFAIENFKRTPDEVDALMALAETKLLEICQHGDLLHQYGVRLHVLGKTSLLPPNVQAAIRKAEELTRDNDRAILNLCMPYAARNEIATAVDLAIDSALSTETADGTHPEITEDDIAAQLMTTRAGSPPLDLLVRTSGVRRLSDFLLWQCSENTHLQFSPTYWPDFGLWDFVPIVLDYQRRAWAAQGA
ncbi:Di-trans-poly-cis-decaprenylcistransferase [Fomitopsis betulina]|nr:Di-trans-poly-cis-decaprenylcistransferase [Fomitopsis betulina]